MTAVFLKGFLQKCRIRHGGGAQNHPVNAEGQIAFRRFHAADAAANLNEQIRLGQNSADHRLIFRLSGLRAFQIHKVQAAGPGPLKFPGDFRGIFTVDCHFGIVAPI